MFSYLLGIHNVGMGTFVLHGLILCVSEGEVSDLLGSIHNVDMGTFVLNVSESLLS